MTEPIENYIAMMENLANNVADYEEPVVFTDILEMLKELRDYRFEINECKAILDHPTPDVTENDKKRAMYVLQTFPDRRGE